MVNRFVLLLLFFLHEIRTFDFLEYFYFYLYQTKFVSHGYWLECDYRKILSSLPK